MIPNHNTTLTTRENLRNKFGIIQKFLVIFIFHETNLGWTSLFQRKIKEKRYLTQKNGKSLISSLINPSNKKLG
jgi:hypothetical protein